MYLDMQSYYTELYEGICVTCSQSGLMEDKRIKMKGRELPGEVWEDTDKEHTQFDEEELSVENT